MKKKYLIPSALILSMLVISALSVSTISAQDVTDYPPIVQKLAETFNLNEDDVQAVFDEERDDHHAQMYANWEERLGEAVESGQITEEQKQAILTKHEEVQNAMLNLKDLTPDERREEMQALHEDMSAWAADNGIDMFGLRPMGRGFKHGMHMHFEEGLNN